MIENIPNLIKEKVTQKQVGQQGSIKMTPKIQHIKMANDKDR